MTTPTKVERDLADLLAAIEKCRAVHPGNANLVVVESTRRLNAMIRRAENIDGWDRITIPQRYGPKYEFTGKILAEKTKEYDDGEATIFELWETIGGNWIAVRETAGKVKAMQFEAGDHMGVMEFWSWNQAAKRIARNLQWNLTVEVE